MFKSGDRSDPNNYRPLSILSVLGKLCERIVCTQLVTYLLDHHILCPQQYGFRPGHSTEHAVLDAVTYATQQIGVGRVAYLVTADTSKAFDSVRRCGMICFWKSWDVVALTAIGLETGSQIASRLSREAHPNLCL